MSYRVTIENGHPFVLDENGHEVEGAVIRGMHFPSRTVSGISGDEIVIVGPITADISVDGELITGVPVGGR